MLHSFWAEHIPKVGVSLWAKTPCSLCLVWVSGPETGFWTRAQRSRVLARRLTTQRLSVFPRTDSDCGGGVDLMWNLFNQRLPGYHRQSVLRSVVGLALSRTPRIKHAVSQRQTPVRRSPHLREEHPPTATSANQLARHNHPLRKLYKVPTAASINQYNRIKIGRRKACPLVKVNNCFEYSPVNRVSIHFHMHHVRRGLLWFGTCHTDGRHELGHKNAQEKESQAFQEKMQRNGELA